MKQQRAYQYRFYPTPEQARILARTFGCARYVYNFALRLRTDAYYQEQKRIGYHETSAELTKLNDFIFRHLLIKSIMGVLDLSSVRNPVP